MFNHVSMLRNKCIHQGGQFSSISLIKQIQQRRSHTFESQFGTITLPPKGADSRLVLGAPQHSKKQIQRAISFSSIVDYGHPYGNYTHQALHSSLIVTCASGQKRGRDECADMVDDDLDSSDDEGPSPSPVNTKPSLSKRIKYSPDDDGNSPGALETHGESSIVNYLKDLSGMKEPIVKMGIEMVGAAYLLKLKRPNCDEIESATEKAVEAANALFHAEELLSESHNTFEKVLKFADDHN